MPDATYSIALATRGAGAFAYSYSGSQDLQPGQVVAVPFQHRLEVGVVVEPDPAPPQVELLPLVPIHLQRWPRLGKLLLELCELSASAPDEIAGHVLFDSARTSLRLSLSLDAEQCSPEALSALAEYSGRLTPTKQKSLVKHAWTVLAEAAAFGAARLECAVAGDPDHTRVPAAWRKTYTVSPEEASLLGVPAQSQLLPGNYLAGFDRLDLKSLQTVRSDPDEPRFAPRTSELEFTATMLPADWELLKLWPRLHSLALRSVHATWTQLRSETGLLSELAAALQAGQRVLVVCPQAWMVERLWPVLVPLARRVSRFRPDAGPGTASQILRLLAAGPHAVFGGPGAWKLAAYHAFDRILLLDPSHPQYAPERTPHLDPRLALLLCAASHAAATVDFLHLGLDAISGNERNVELMLHEPAEPPGLPGARPALSEHADVDPLPLELRRPDLRRLVYFNRLGSGRGLYCAECWAAVACPQCGSARIHFSPRQHAYVCPDCAAEERELRCLRCHLIALVSVLPGLESVTRRPGDLVLHGPQLDSPPPAQWHSVIGTSHLLDPLPGYWPQQITYVHAEGRVGLSADWPGAIDMALRLAALYDNPELTGVHIVSARLVEQFGDRATPPEIQQRYAGELELCELAGLPPNGTLYHLRGIAARQGALEEGRRLLGESLHDLPGTTLLRLGTSFRQGGAYRFGGWLVNRELALRDLQELRWKLHRAQVTLAIHPLRGPWVW